MAKRDGRPSDVFTSDDESKFLSMYHRMTSAGYKLLVSHDPETNAPTLVYQKPVEESKPAEAASKTAAAKATPPRVSAQQPAAVTQQAQRHAIASRPATGPGRFNR